MEKPVEVSKCSPSCEFGKKNFPLGVLKNQHPGQRHNPRNSPLQVLVVRNCLYRLHTNGGHVTYPLCNLISNNSGPTYPSSAVVMYAAPPGLRPNSNTSCLAKKSSLILPCGNEGLYAEIHDSQGKVLSFRRSMIKASGYIYSMTHSLGTRLAVLEVALCP